MSVLGDVYFIADRVKEFDSLYSLRWNEKIKRYQVVQTRRIVKQEGAYNGHPLFAMHDFTEVVLTWDEVNCAPDMRIIRKLEESDVWRYPGGPAKYYDDMMADSEKRKQKREDNVNDRVNYTANEYAPFIKNEIDGVRKTFHHIEQKVV